MRLSLLILISLLVLSSHEGLVFAETVTNSTFDTDLAGWSFAPGTAVWSNVDSSGLPTSGSARLTSSGSVAFAERCVGIKDPVSNYVIGGKVFIPDGQPTGSGDVTLQVGFFRSSDCTGGGDLGVVLFFPGLRAGGWTPTLTSGIGPLPDVKSVAVVLWLQNPQATAYFDDVLVSTNAAATLAADRFSVGVAWKTTTGQIGVGSAVNLTAESAYFTFFDPSNVEVIVKVLNGCPLNQRYWVFAGGLTNVETYVTVDDNIGNSSRAYQNPQGRAFIPIQDTSALQTCP